MNRFNNPLKYQTGGQMKAAEEQLISAVAQSLGAKPEQVKARLDEIKANPQETQVLQQALQLMQQDKNAGFNAILNLFSKASNQSYFKEGGKIKDFICKHAKGGHVAGCGCGKSIPKAQEGHPALGQNYIQREYDGDGNAIYFLAPERKYLPINMKMDPTSDYQQQGGEYQGNGQISIIDFGNGKLRVQKDPYGPFGEVAHGKDSAAYVNRALELMKKSGMKPSSGFVQSNQEGGELTRKEALRLGRENKGYNRAQARLAYQNAKNSIRSQGGKGREMRQTARQWVAGQNEAPYYLTPAQKDRYNEVNYGTGTVMSQPLSQGPVIAVPSNTIGLVGERPQDVMSTLNTMSFNNAFRTALNNGKTVFIWKGKPYTTELAQKPSWTNIDVNSLPEDIQNNLTGNVEIEIPEVEEPNLSNEHLILQPNTFEKELFRQRLNSLFRVNNSTLPSSGLVYKKGGKIK